MRPYFYPGVAVNYGDGRCAKSVLRAQFYRCTIVGRKINHPDKPFPLSQSKLRSFLFLIQPSLPQNIVESTYFGFRFRTSEPARAPQLLSKADSEGEAE